MSILDFNFISKFRRVCLLNINKKLTISATIPKTNPLPINLNQLSKERLGMTKEKIIIKRIVLITIRNETL